MTIRTRAGTIQEKNFLFILLDMEQYFSNKFEALPRHTIIPPAVESLLAPDSSESFWPETIRNDRNVHELAETRRHLSSDLSSYYTKVPRVETDIADAIENGAVDEREVATLYDSLSEMIGQDSANRRIVLYLPFEFLPSKDQAPRTEELVRAAARFTDTVRSSWESLLTEQEARADFVDGDIPEPSYQTEPLPLVVKAAHLIPELVSHGLLSPIEVIEKMEASRDSILSESIADALPVLADMGLLGDDDLERMSRSDNRLVANMSRIIRAQSESEIQILSEQEPVTDLSAVLSDLRANLKTIDTEYGLERSDRTHARANWLRKTATSASIDVCAEKIRFALSRGTIVPKNIEQAVFDHPEEHTSTLAIIETVRKTVDEIAKSDTIQASERFQDFSPLLTRLWNGSADPEIHDSLETAFRHFHSMRIVDSGDLDRLGITLIGLDAGFSVREGNLKDDIDSVEAMTTAIESDPELLKMLYPVGLLLGSRVKGYAKRTADLDTAVFVRPGTPFEERSFLQEHLAKVTDNTPMEFWLEEKDGNLSPRYFDRPDPRLGDNIVCDPLLGAWCGNASSIQELHERMLTGYLHSEGKTIFGHDAREIWLKEMEHKTLKYRLMHKGYERFHPKRGGIHTDHSAAIDADSTFYDSGYRRLATKLFVDRVFLPKLENSAPEV